MYKVFIALAGFLILAGVACGGSPEKQSISVAEYAESICSGDNLDEGTWGDVIGQIQSAIDTGNGINPPSELSGYHKAITASLNELLKVAKDKPSDEDVNVLDLLSESKLIASGLAIGVEEEKLSPSTLQTLRDAGCD